MSEGRRRKRESGWADDDGRGRGEAEEWKVHGTVGRRVWKGKKEVRGVDGGGERAVTRRRGERDEGGAKTKAKRVQLRV